MNYVKLPQCENTYIILPIIIITLLAQCAKKGKNDPDTYNGDKLRAA